MPLTGLRVLEIVDEKGAYCGKLLADLGAEVISIEPPGGASLRFLPPLVATGPRQGESLFFLYTHTSKKSVTLNIATPQGRSELLALAAGSDLIVESLPPGELDRLGLSFAELSALNPKLVLTSISGFGQNGPYHNYRSCDRVASAMGGAMGAVGDPEDPPVALAGSQALFCASTLAAASSLIALRHSAKTGQGQAIDISLQEAMLAVTSICGVGKWLGDGVVSKRCGTALFAATPSGTYPCKDGLAYLMVNRPLHWQALSQWTHEVTGNEEILDPMFAGPSSNRQPYRELLDLFLCELSQRYSVEEFYREGQRRHLAITPVNTLSRILTDPHLASRGFFVEPPNEAGVRYPGAPYRLSKTPWQLRNTAPKPGADNGRIEPRTTRPSPQALAGRAPALPLAGIRVVEFTAGMAGPWIGRIMAWCGAEVIKIESSRFPDVTRLYIPPGRPDLGIQPQLSPWLTDWNAGKRFLSLDLTREGAADIAKRVIDHADIVIDNNGNGVLEKLGLGFSELEKRKPGLVLFNTTGFGNSGPDAAHISWGPNIEAISGLSHLSGYAHRECTMTQFAYPDPLAALHGLVAILAALRYRDSTGVGQRINLSQLETVLATMGDLLLEQITHGAEPPRTGNSSPFFAPEGCYRCAGEDRWCVITTRSEAEWQALCLAMGKPEWISDERFATLAARLANRDTLDAQITAWSCQQDAHTVMNHLQQAGITAGVVQDVEDQWQRDPHLQARGFFETIPHPLQGTVIAPGIPLGFTATPGRTSDTGRAPGADNHAILCGLAGLTEEEYRAAVERGVIEASHA